MLIHDALPIAKEIFERLKVHCYMTDIAGSVRRWKQEVKDIEICCSPHQITKGEDLFGAAKGTERSPAFIAEVKALGEILKGDPKTGRYVQIKLTVNDKSINLDLFIPQAHDYIRQLIIRTGPSDYSHKIIAGGWKKRGWVGTDEGLRRAEQCISKDLGDGKFKHICTVTNPILPPVWQDESEFFAWIGVDYVTPERRFVK